ncbi:MAG: glycosyltransferase family 39 protein [Actinomycetota bacterium]
MVAEVCTAAVLAAAAHRLGGPGTARATLLAGAVLLARRGRAGAWLADPPRFERGRTGMAVGRAALLVVAAVVLAHAGSAGRMTAVPLLVLAAVVLLPAHRLFWDLDGGKALAIAFAGGVVVLVAGGVSVRYSPLGSLSAGLGLVGGDLAMAVVAAAFRRVPEPSPPGRPAGTGGPEAAMPAVAFAAVAAMPLLGLARGIDSSDLGLLAALVVIGLPPLALAGTAPAFFVRGLGEGRRDAIVPALLLGAGLGAAAALILTAVPDVLVGLSDKRLVRHAPNFALAMTFLGLSQILVHHLVAARRSLTPLVHVGIAIAFQAAMMTTATGTDTAVAVNAALAGAAVLLTGLAVSTLVSAPFDFTVPAEEATDGPRRLGWILASVTVAAVAVRLASTRDFWIDEATSARAVDRSLSTMLEAVRGSDPHPPLHLVLTWLAHQAFGEGTLAVRMPSVVAGTLLVPLLYLVGKELYDRRVGIVAAALAAFAPALVWFSTEARPPVLAAFLAALSLLAMVRALRRGRASDWVLFGLAGAALIWSHQLAWVHVAVLHAAAGLLVWRGEKTARRRCMTGWAGATTVVVLAGVALAAYRSGIGPPPALPPFEYATRAAPGEGTSLFPVIGSGVSALIGLHPPDVTSRLLALWPLGILLSLLGLGRARSERGVLLVALSAAPFVALFAAQVLGIPRHPAFALGWAATAIPMVVLLAARAVTSLGGRWPRVRGLALGLAALLALGLVDQAVRVQPIPRYDVGPLVEQAAGRARAGDVVVFEPRALRDLVRFRAPDGVATRSVSGTSSEDVEGQGRVIVVAAFGLSTSDESGERVLSLVKELSSSRRLVAERGRPDVKMWEFE